MLWRCSIIVAALILCLGARVAPAAPFVNLDFEQATIPPGTPPGFVNASAAFPGWTASIGGIAVTSVYFDSVGIGEAAITLYDMPLSVGGFPVLQGEYSAALVTEINSLRRTALSQLADVPSATRSIRLLAPQFRAPPLISLDGVTLALARLSPPGGFNDPALYAADVTAFAGTSAELTLLSTLPPSGLLCGVDAIEFSAIEVPEPAGGLAVASAFFIVAAKRMGRGAPYRRRLQCKGREGSTTGTKWRLLRLGACSP